MKFCSVDVDGRREIAVKLEGGVVLLSRIQDHIEGADSFPSTLDEALWEADGLSRLRTALGSVVDSDATKRAVLPDGQYAPAVIYTPRNILCVGLNYRDHAAESKSPIPEKPILFAKWTGSVIAPEQPIVLPPDTHEVDYEAELALVIGRRCRSVSEADALDYVAAYTCMNDVSARDFQRGDGQWVRAKSQDTFAPFGPYLVTPDEIPDPQTLSISCTVSGRKLQDSNTAQMIFTIRQLIAYISRGVTLQPGDLITTGTPNGVGFAQKPPLFLKDGDRVDIEISSIGRLSNPVAAG